MLLTEAEWDTLLTFYGGGQSAMTLVSGIWESESSFLIGADSGEVDSETGLTGLCQKIYADEDKVLVWGMSGTDGHSDRMNGWLKAYAWPPPKLECIRR